MKKILAAAAVAVGLMMSGCKSGGLTLDGNKAVIDGAGVYVDIPKGWDIYTGDEIYRAESGAGESMKADDEKTGTAYLLLAKSEDENIVVRLTRQDITADGNGGTLENPMTAEEYARSCHDTALFDYFASGFRSGGDSVFESVDICGKNGWYSGYEIYLSEEDGGEFVYGHSEYMFEGENGVYSLMTSYFNKESREQAQSVAFSLLA